MGRVDGRTGGALELAEGAAAPAGTLGQRSISLSLPAEAANTYVAVEWVRAGGGEEVVEQAMFGNVNFGPKAAVDAWNVSQLP